MNERIKRKVHKERIKKGPNYANCHFRLFHLLPYVFDFIIMVSAAFINYIEQQLNVILTPSPIQSV